MKPMVIAHRGACGYLPEHTLAAKALAHEMGADYLEQDIVASRDDELIVLHDIHLDRVSDVAARFPDRHREDGRFYVRDFDLQEIRTLHAWERMHADGSPVYPGRYPAKSGDFRIHTFAEELEFIQQLNAESGRQVGVYAEIKRPGWHRQDGVDIAPKLLEELAQIGYGGRSDPVFVQCFEHAELLRLRRELNCPYKLVQLIGGKSWSALDSAHAAIPTAAGLAQISSVVDAIGPSIGHLYELTGDDALIVPNRLSAWAHDAGLAVHPYTFRADEIPPGFSSFEELVYFFVENVRIDGLFTDFPDKVIQLRFP